LAPKAAEFGKITKNNEMAEIAGLDIARLDIDEPNRGGGH